MKKANVSQASSPLQANRFQNKEREDNRPKKLIYTRDDFLRHQPKFYELPSNFYDIRALFKEPYKPEKASEVSGFNTNKSERSKTRVKGLSKGDEREILSDDSFPNPSGQLRRNSVIF